MILNWSSLYYLHYVNIRGLNKSFELEQDAVAEADPAARVTIRAQQLDLKAALLFFFGHIFVNLKIPINKEA